MKFRKAVAADIPAVAEIYADILTEQEAGRAFVGWARGVYPTEKTANMALERGDLFVQEVDGAVTGAAIINQIQVNVYEGAAWQYPAGDEEGDK